MHENRFRLRVSPRSLHQGVQLAANGTLLCANQYLAASQVQIRRRLLREQQLNARFQHTADLLSTAAAMGGVITDVLERHRGR